MSIGVYYAWVKFSMGGVDFILEKGTPQHLISFRHELEVDSFGKWQIEIFDPTFYKIEQMLWRIVKEGAQLEVEFQYGISFPDGSTIESPKFYGYFERYSPRWTYTGVTITLEGSVGRRENYHKKTSSYKGMKVSDIFKQICQEEGWKIGRVDETEEIMVPEDQTTTLPVHKTFRRNRQSAIQFIKTQLIPMAVRKSDGRTGYIFYLDSTTKPPTANFFIPEDGSFNPAKVFSIRKSSEETWIEFTYDINLTAAEAFGAFQVVSANYNPITGEPIIDERDVVKDQDKIYKYNQADVYMQPSSELSSVPYINPRAAHYPQEHRHKNIARMALQYRGVFDATLTVMGDPTCSVIPGHFVQINNYLPNGDLHYSSGIYLVTKVTNEIQGGSFTTTYELKRNSAPKEPS